MAFNQKEYIQNYKKDKYKKISIDYPKEEAKKIDEFCKETGITKKEIFKVGYEESLKRSKKI